MAAIPMGAVAMQPKMAEGASLFRPTLAGLGVWPMGDSLLRAPSKTDCQIQVSNDMCKAVCDAL